MLTGKNKERFESYYLNLPNSMGLNYGNRQTTLNKFYSLPLSMQFGVYVDYADSIGYEISTFGKEINGFIEWAVANKNNSKVEVGAEKTRDESRKAAIKAFDEIVNSAT